jgi:hypothetical protein
MPCAEEESHLGPHHPPALWSAEGGHCKDMPHQLHYMGDIPNGEPVLTGANHDFIIKACTQKHQLSIEYLHTPYMISTPGGKILSRQVVVNPSLNLGGRVYQTCLIVLEGQGIDVILGIN